MLKYIIIIIALLWM